MPSLSQTPAEWNSILCDSEATRKRYWFLPSVADCLFMFVLCTFFFLRSSRGMMDDPGLGWHLRIADAMWEQGGFVFTEQFCFTSEGSPWITKAWLADILMRLSYAWADLSGVAALTALVVALTVRLSYLHIRNQGIHWSVALMFGFVACIGMAPATAARPNVFTLLGVLLVASIVENFHNGRIDRNKTLFLLPIFILWPNVHGGYIGGIVILCVSYLCEIWLSCFANRAQARAQARSRLMWWTQLGPLLFLCTLVNPNFWHLHVWTLNMITDPFLQNQTTVEWLAPDFKNSLRELEIIILMFPALAAVSRFRPSLVSLALAIVWLHFALTSMRYIPLWVTIAVPTMAMFFTRSHISFLVGRFMQKFWSKAMWQLLASEDRDSSWWRTVVLALAFFLAVPALGPWARFNPGNVPVVGLNRLLETSQGERVFHSINWGGYLTLYGWKKNPRFQTFIDDRIDVHGQTLTENYFEIMAAGPRWRELLNGYQVRLMCIPRDAPLLPVVTQDPKWITEYEDQDLVILRQLGATDGQ